MTSSNLPQRGEVWLVNFDPTLGTEIVHETAKDLYEAGVMDLVTMREFDRLCLPAILFQRGFANEPLEPIQIKQIRESTNVSQAVFAAILNTSLSTVQNGRSGKKDRLARH